LSNAAPSGVSGMCAHGRLLNDEKLVSLALDAMNTLFNQLHVNPHGMYTVDFKEDFKGVPRLTEINIRHVSFTWAFSLGGANFCEDSLRLHIGDPTFDMRFKPYVFEEASIFIRGVDSELFLIGDGMVKQVDR